MPSSPAPPRGFAVHDHEGCVRSGLDAAETACRARGLRLTPTRRRVLEILLEEHSAKGAYDILRRLGAAQPPVAYRALSFLVEAGLAHRIQRLNAFVACARPGTDHAAAFLICRGCGAVAETAADPEQALAPSAAETGFAIDDAVLEAEGLCPSCRT
jgi:Fur family zinc uptake transcriptional regulator